MFCIFCQLVDNICYFDPGICIFISARSILVQQWIQETVCFGMFWKFWDNFRYFWPWNMNIHIQKIKFDSTRSSESHLSPKSISIKRQSAVDKGVICLRRADISAPPECFRYLFFPPRILQLSRFSRSFQFAEWLRTPLNLEKIMKIRFGMVWKFWDNLWYSWPWNMNIHIQKNKFDSTRNSESSFLAPNSDFQFP